MDARREKVLQCGRGSIPRKVGLISAALRPMNGLQCGRGSIPRKVTFRRKAIMEAIQRLQCGRGSIPRKVAKGPPRCRLRAPASMWPGEYPPEGRGEVGRDVEPAEPASMWPGEYPPEGRRPPLNGSSPAPRFNVAGGVSPGKVGERPDRGTGERAASMWPGEYPPEGRVPSLARSLTRTAGFNVAGGVSPGRSPRSPTPAPLPLGRFNVAGGVSPGRSLLGDGAVVFAVPLQCGRGSIPRKVAERRRTASKEAVASMWPGEYPPEGRRSSRGVKRPTRAAASMWPGEYPPEGPARTAPPNAASASFNVAGGVSPGRSWTGRRSRMSFARLQCGRGSIPRKVIRALMFRALAVQPLQCGRGSIPRKVRRSPPEPSGPSQGFNVAGGVSPGRSGSRPSGANPRLRASMWPGEYPPEGREASRHRLRVSE